MVLQLFCDLWKTSVTFQAGTKFGSDIVPKFKIVYRFSLGTDLIGLLRNEIDDFFVLYCQIIRGIYITMLYYVSILWSIVKYENVSLPVRILLPWVYFALYNTERYSTYRCK